MGKNSNASSPSGWCFAEQYRHAFSAAKETHAAAPRRKPAAKGTRLLKERGRSASPGVPRIFLRHRAQLFPTFGEFRETRSSLTLPSLNPVTILIRNSMDENR